MFSPIGGSLPPNDEHAVSVSLPLWRDVMGWASRDPAVLTKLESGYPRFYVPHLVRRLEDSVIKWIDSRPQSVLGDSQQKTKFAGLAVKLFPNQTMANACRAYLQKRRHNNDEAHHIRLVAVEAHGGLTTIQCGYPEQTASPKIIVYTMIYPNALEAEAKAFWQHTGYGISSRFAQLWLDHAPFLNDTHASSMEDIFRLPILQAKEAALKIRSRIAASYTGSDNKVQQDDIFLYQTGMTAIAQTALMLQSHIQSETRWKLRVAVFGFLYVDTFKVLSKIFGFECVLYGNVSPADMEKFQEDLEAGFSFDAFFTEFPGNPLLGSLDLERVYALSRRYGFMVVVDDTVGTSTNTDLLRHCDIICTSLTKIFSGACNVMGGSALINPLSEHYDIFRREMTDSYCEGYFPLDIIVMERNSIDFDSRIRIASWNAEQIADVLRGHKSVQQVFYPKGSPTQSLYTKYKREDEGYGYLLSVQFVRPRDGVAFHDALNVAKGPSLGTNFTLACAYTLLAHYSELEWAAEHGVVENLVRISVGLEDIDDLIKVVERALEATGPEKPCGRT